MIEEPYCATLLLALITRDTFKHLANYEVFEECVDKIPIKMLDELSKNQEYSEKFMEFMRYVKMQATVSPQYEHGDKLIKKMYDVTKFKAYQEQSLQILDHESIILDEEGPGVGVTKDISAKKKAIKDIDVSILHQALIDGSV